MEFALVMPAFLFIILAGLTFGQVIYAKHAAELAARETARTYAVFINNTFDRTQVETLARNAAASNMKGILPGNRSEKYFDPNSDVTVEQGSLHGGHFYPGAGAYCRATIQARVPIFTPWFRRLLGETTADPFGNKDGNEYVKDITGIAVFRMEPRIGE
ncbi:MAG: TadE/TadG family type IV pilus assembly protein [Solirubrobacterales bacterium]